MVALERYERCMPGVCAAAAGKRMGAMRAKGVSHSPPAAVQNPQAETSHSCMPACSPTSGTRTEGVEVREQTASLRRPAHAHSEGGAQQRRPSNLKEPRSRWDGAMLAPQRKSRGVAREARRRHRPREALPAQPAASAPIEQFRPPRPLHQSMKRMCCSGFRFEIPRSASSAACPQARCERYVQCPRGRPRISTSAPFPRPVRAYAAGQRQYGYGAAFAAPEPPQRQPLFAARSSTFCSAGTPRAAQRRRSAPFARPALLPAALLAARCFAATPPAQ